MFEPQDRARVFYVPPGADFPQAVRRGLQTHLSGHAPDVVSDVRILANAGRMLTRMRQEFTRGAATFLPRLSLVTDLSVFLPLEPKNTPVPELRRQLDLAQLVERAGGLSAPSSAFDVARALAVLLDEMDGEGVDLAALHSLKMDTESQHWQRALALVSIAAEYQPGRGPDAVARQRALTLIQNWERNPPSAPILVAGSTGSRGTTALIMGAVAKLPNGALILPGFDPNVPDSVWSQLESSAGQEDHPQYRYAALMAQLGISAVDVEPWDESASSIPNRAKLISLSLRPAPVTHHWLREGPELPDLIGATQDMTLIQAKDQRAEANAIALILRQAAEDGQSAAVITPDRNLTRRVAAALDRWGIVPDDSAGVPLSLTAPGRLLLQLARMRATGIAADTLIALLKHPLTASGDGRGQHLLQTRAFELKLRRKGPPFPTANDVIAWANEDDTRKEWGAWLARVLEPAIGTTLPEHLTELETVANTLSAGPGRTGSGALWAEAPGRAALATLTQMKDAALDEDALSLSDFAVLLAQTLGREPVRVLNDIRPDIMIWGTLEARAQGADLVILAGLNDGIWPAAPDPDPWMNRSMRAAAGLLSPERQIGLSAHDYQQAVCAARVVMTRATKSDDAETVSSRWLNRLTTLLNGLKDQGGPQALAAMRERGDVWLGQAARLDIAARIAPASRPSPIPPVSVRPTSLSVTEIKTLIRDPYAIYAKHILRLHELDPLAQTPDARLRGTVIHKIMEVVMAQGLPTNREDIIAHINTTAEQILTREVPWPAARLMWAARLDRIAPWIADGEIARRAQAQVAKLEARAEQSLTNANFTLRGTADRIDLTADGSAHIYDYKTGSPPSKQEQEHFDKQLPLEAAMMERGGFKELPPALVTKAAYIGLGTKPEERLSVSDAGEAWSELALLIAAMQGPDHGFTARRAMQKDGDESPYDLLSRYGEWGPADAPDKVRV